MFYKCQSISQLWALTLSLPQPVKFPGWKMYAYMPADNIFDGPITNLLSILNILIEILSCTHAKRSKSFNVFLFCFFKFGTFIGRFPSDGAACMAVKGLILWTRHEAHSGRKIPLPHLGFEPPVLCQVFCPDSLPTDYPYSGLTTVVNECEILFYTLDTKDAITTSR